MTMEKIPDFSKVENEALLENYSREKSIEELKAENEEQGLMILELQKGEKKLIKAVAEWKDKSLYRGRVLIGALVLLVASIGVTKKLESDIRDGADAKTKMSERFERVSSGLRNISYIINEHKDSLAIRNDARIVRKPDFSAMSEDEKKNLSRSSAQWLGDEAGFEIAATDEKRMSYEGLSDREVTEIDEVITRLAADVGAAD